MLAHILPLMVAYFFFFFVFFCWSSSVCSVRGLSPWQQLAVGRQQIEDIFQGLSSCRRQRHRLWTGRMGPGGGLHISPLLTISLTVFCFSIDLIV